MGRQNREGAEIVVDTVVTEKKLDTVVETVVVKEEVAEKPAPKGLSFSFTASFKTRNMEGDRINHKYQGVGKTFAEALDTVVGSEEDLVDEYNKPFPKGINCLVNVVVRSSAGYEFSRALAPHTAKDILENKNVGLAIKLLGL